MGRGCSYLEHRSNYTQRTLVVFIVVIFLCCTPYSAMAFKLSSLEMQKLLHRVKSLNVPQQFMDNMIEFHIQDKLVGYCSPSFAKTLSSFPRVFTLTEDRQRIKFVPEVDQLDVSGRTAAAHEVSLVLKDEGLVTRWRDEMLAVSSSFHDEPLLLLERAVVPFFGTKAYGCHIIGFVRDSSKRISHLWVAKRSMKKSTWPGLWDHIAAGALPYGISLMENVIKECQEEASIPPQLSTHAVHTSTLTYRGLDEDGNLKRDCVFCYDLELPPEFTPVPSDGEVESFSLKSLQWVMNRLLGREASDDETIYDAVDYKPNCNLVLIDFFLRHGLIDPSSPHYEELKNSLCTEQ